MAYDDLKAQFGRRLVWIVRLLLPKCALDYGTSPCTAAIGSGGFTTECYRTLGTCQDKANYDGSGSQTVVFTSEFIPGLQAAGGLVPFPWILDVDTAPTRLEPGRGLGIRASASVTLQDGPWTDIGFDPYLNTRTAAPVTNPDRTGTMIAKLIRRQKFWEGREMEIEVGYLDANDEYDAANFLKRHYLIQEVKGPDTSGKITITGRDPLRLADSDRTLYPAVSEGALSGAHTDSVTTLTLGTGQGTAYAGVSYVRVDDEVMAVTGNTADTLTVTRATLPAIYPAGTIVAEAHEDGATVQACAYFNAVRIDSVVNTLLTAAKIPASYLPTADWTSLADDWLASHTLSTLITEPTSVKNLLEELTQHLLLLWWDDRDQEVKLDAVKPAANNNPPVFDEDDDILEGSVDVISTVKHRLSRVVLHYALRNPVENLKDKANYRITHVSADGDAETAEEYGTTPRLMEIFSRWLPVGSAVPAEITSRLLAEYRDVKMIVRTTVDPKDDEVWTGDMFFVRSRQIQDEHGQNRKTKCLVLEAKETLSKRGARYSYLAQETALTGKVMFIAPDEDLESAPDPFPDYTAASEAEKAYGFICDSSTLLMSNGDEPSVIS